MSVSPKSDPPASARLQLRAETRVEHDRVDAAFSRFDLATPTGYRDFLLAQARAFTPVEQALDGARIDTLVADWPVRKRSDLLAQDLADLGAAPPAAADAPAFATPAAALGAAYVLEGSRLGGALLSRQLPADAPNRFLLSDGMGQRWRDLLAVLERELTTPQDIDAAVASAKSVFARFEAAAS